MDADKSFVVEISNCRVCESHLLDHILNFGHMPLANGYPKDLEDEDIYAPLEVVLCRKCGCVQLRHTVDPKVLYVDYLYTSSTSGSLKEYFRKYAQDTVDKFGWKPGDEKFIVGIGGNDGPLEMDYQRLGFKVLNVEASDPISKLSAMHGVQTFCAWFDEGVASQIVAQHGQADLITCNHCFAHMPDINGVMRAIKIMLKPDGWFVFEEAYWMDTVAGNHFDQIYHEHVFYWTISAVDYLVGKHGLIIPDVEFNQSQGGSIRVFVRNNARHADNSHGDNKVRNARINEIIDHQMHEIETYREWWGRIMDWRGECREFLEPLDSICCYGVPAKFTMISEQLKFTPADPFDGVNAIKILYAVEDSKIKVGRFTPGSRIPIVDRNRFVSNPTGHCIITAANYADLIVAANPQYKGRWITLFPTPRFIE